MKKKPGNQKNNLNEPINMNANNKSDVTSDVLGSYTGIAEDGEPPIQDADDL